MNIHEQMVAVTRKIAAEGISKSRKNVQQGYNFRGVDEVMQAFAPILADAGLYLRPRFTERDVAERQSQKGGALFYVTVRGEFDFANDAGEAVTVGPFYGEAMDSGDKATNKAMATAFKYAMFQTFCVPLEGVTGGDADLSTHDVRPVATLGKTTPTDGAWDRQPPESQAFLQDIADNVAGLLTTDEAAAWDYLHTQQLDSDEKIALWARLDSKQRSALKRAEASTKKEAA